MALLVRADWDDAAAQMATRGSFSVSSTGAAVYVTPIAVPPGTAGMEPSLALTYSSQSGNGTLGMGWSLSGLMTIVRCPQTLAQDGVHGSLNYDGNDRFCLNGQRLVAINNGSYGADGTEYRTEIDGFSRIVSHGGAGNGPAWFEVRTKAGQIMEFGRTADAFVPVTSGAATARLWALDKVSDPKGNSLAVSYTLQANLSQALPSRIDYTSNSTAGLAPYASVQFVYGSRSDVRPQYLVGALIETTQRLTNVKTFVGSNLVADYQLGYQQGSVTGRSRLISMKPCGGDGNCLPATGFAYADGNGQSDLLVKITDGLTRTTAVTYAPLTNGGVYTKDTSAVYPLQDWQGPMNVVSRVDVSDGVGGTASSTYAYAGARVDISGRGLLPFRQTVMTDLQTNIVQTTNYRQDYPFIGLVASASQVLGSQTLSETLNSYLFSNAAGNATVSTPTGTAAPYTVSLQQGVATGHDLDGSTVQAVKTGYQFDAFGNPTQVTSSTWDGFVKTTTNTYTNDTTNWLLGRLTAATVTSQVPAGGTGSTPSQNPDPDLTVTISHTGKLSQGQVGVTYTIVVSNVATWPSAGLVSVTDQLPAGLIATAIGGSGWSCSASNLTCTRSDPLAGSTSYPPVTVTVNVAANAPASITNTATVSGGGDVNPSNNSASDTGSATQSVTIASSTYNLNLWDYLVGNGYATSGQAGSFVVTIASGVVIGSSSTGAYALDTGVFPSGSALQIVNNGIITGAGGAGSYGQGGPCLDATGSFATPYPGNPGGPALHAQTPVSIVNNGSIWGGGGGGSGGIGMPGGTLNGRSGGGAGGGAGSVPGSGGLDVYSGNALSTGGQPGTLTSGGAGSGTVGAYGGGSGGGPGQAGMGSYYQGTNGNGQRVNYCVGTGGAAGASAVGNSYVTWIATGDVRGPMPAAQIADLIVITSHGGDFAQGQSGAAYTLTVSNVGASASSGTVTVTDTLPSELTATAIGGSGWSCTLSNLTCIRSDALAGGSSYPVITLTVNVASSAPASVTNTASVSGGSDGNTTNNTASDQTAITPTTVPPTSVTIASSTSNLNLWNYLVSSGYASAGVAGSWVVTINNGVVIGSSSTGAYALDTGVFPSGSALQIVNNGIITGAGGAGSYGQGGPCLDATGSFATPYPGNPGGPALHAQTPVSIVNNGSIWGGGGGGSGGIGMPGGTLNGRSGGGAGGGAGSVPGSGGLDVYSGNALSTGGQPGTLTSGGAGSGTVGAYGGGSGGGPGQAGMGSYYQGTNGNGQRVNYCVGTGGAAGASVVGNSYVRWSTTGDVRGSLN
ncbi:SpvB/TcaC N-terminal domain-containing protein [Bradyrhizobium sp. SZCCHNR1039]|uniref:SpvB/TcaC N-terminal domain-containing protein n=1 Tax=Bradyrhizobium sp. SZCCHNR1039 TaxID=3057350 RepID=UPI00291654A6|nr:SpvB/TcaC N-terminal domain-containing protein [Bradyrhizobium sp. SZCCHNR1039]